MKERAMSLEERALTATAIELTPRSAAGGTIGADIAQPGPAAIGAVRLRTEMLGGGDVAPTASRRGDLGGRGGRERKHGGLSGLLTGRAVGLAGETGKGLRFFGALARWRHRLSLRRMNGSGFRWPQPREHEEQPYECDQHNLVEKEVGYHDKVPSHRW
jgi:hypothetical protein